MYNLTKLDVCILDDERSKKRLKGRVQKLASAAQIALAKQTLLQDHDQCLA